MPQLLVILPEEACINLYDRKIEKGENSISFPQSKNTDVPCPTSNTMSMPAAH